MQTAKDHYIIFNSVKCHIRQPQIAFYGAMFTAQGMQPDQVRVLNFMSTPSASSDDKSEALDTAAEAEADSPHSNKDESPTSRPKARPFPKTRGGVTNKMLAAELHLQTSSGVTNMLVPRLLTNAQRRSHPQGTASVPKAPLDQPS